MVLADMPDAARKQLSSEWRSRWQASPVKATLLSVREGLQDLILGPRPRGFFKMPFFEQLAAEGGHGCRIVQQTPEIERSAWRVNVVIRKAP
ncbi:MAG: hypothetical protein ABFE07_11645 [Armatimonadia bacterium]